LESEINNNMPVDPAQEREYNLRIRHPERGAIYDSFAARSAELRASCVGYAPMRYAEGKGCVLDFFAAPVPGPAPLFIFVHGGYWRALDRGIFSFMAAPWLARGAHVAMIGYDLAPALGVTAIVAEVGAALHFLRGRAAAFGIDLQRVVISGHSAGAQLGAMQLCTPGWRPAGYVGVSGVYDLQPLLATSINRDVRLDAAEARAMSPIHRPATAGTRHICAVGADETAGFRSQSHAYAAYLRQHQCEAVAIELPCRNHFDVLEDLANPEHDLFRRSYGLLPAA
jgi:arylformamidase